MQEKIMEKAREFLSIQLGYHPAQWEYSAAKSFEPLQSLDEVIEGLNSAQPNVRIMAAQILGSCSGLYNQEQHENVETALVDKLKDDSSNTISGTFQCEEEEENTKVNLHAANSLIQIGYACSLPEVYAKAIDEKAVSPRSIDPKIGELIWKVNGFNEELGFVQRAEAEKQGVYHRTAHVLIFTDKNYEQIRLQLRGKKAQSELKYCQTASGHVMYGESYLGAAKLEIDEELFSYKGVPEELLQSLEFLCTYRYEVKDEKRDNKEWVALYRAHYSGEFNPDPKEVVEVRTVPMIHLIEDTKKHPEFYTKSFLHDIGFLLTINKLGGK